MSTVLLNARNQALSMPEVYKGSLNSSLIREDELLKKAIRRKVAALIVVHDHPSGDPTPSPEDNRVTSEIVQAVRLIDVEVLDHLIIGKQRYVSLKERGLGFK